MTYQMQSLENDLNFDSPLACFIMISLKWTNQKKKEMLSSQLQSKLEVALKCKKYFYPNDHEHFVTPNNKVFIIINFWWSYLFSSPLSFEQFAHIYFQVFINVGQLLKNNEL
jgi:hypothetical protein